MFDFSFANILNSNVFNFALMVFILYKLCKKPIVGFLQSESDSVAANMSESEEKKQNAKKALKAANLEEKAIPDKTAKMKRDAEKTLATLSKKLESDFVAFKETKIKSAAKRLESDKDDMIRNLTDEFMVVSTDKAKSEVIENLNNNPDLHDRIIEKIIGEI